MLRVAIVAGEHSGDLLAAGLIRALRDRVGALEVSGIAGPAMQAEDCAVWDSIDRLAVMGLPEIIRRYPELKALQRETIARVIALRPDVFIGVDAPEFNLGLEIAVRAAGIPTVHYVSPSVWAWREGRLKTIRRGVDLMLTLFPFEASWFRDHTLPVEFVGHPLSDDLADGPTRAASRASLGWDAEEPVLAVLPGSRMSELKHHAEPFLKAAARCAERIAGLRVAVPLVDARAVERWRNAAAQYAPELAISTYVSRSRDVLAAADVALIASGTATFEALLLGCPMVIAYRGHWLSYALIRPLIRVNRFGLPNLLAGTDVVPECIQRDANAQTLADRLMALLGNAQARAAQRECFMRLKAQLGRGASDRAAAAVLALLGRLRENTGR